jgi:hypothetical protein
VWAYRPSKNDFQVSACPAVTACFGRKQILDVISGCLLSMRGGAVSDQMLIYTLGCEHALFVELHYWACEGGGKRLKRFPPANDG